MSVSAGDAQASEEEKVRVDPGEQRYNEALGARIRAVRMQMGLSLKAVDAMSSHEFRSSALGAYERGERSISVGRLQRLALVYRVPVDQMLPRLTPSPTVGLTSVTDQSVSSDPGHEGTSGPKSAETRRRRRPVRAMHADTLGSSKAGLTPRSRVRPGLAGASAADSRVETAAAGGQVAGGEAGEKVTIDLSGLEELAGPEHEVLSRYVGMVQIQRQDFNGRVLTMRSDDIRAIGCLFGVAPNVMKDRLGKLGLIAGS
ncbi:MAG: helix-turn-helix domain-containing protein [Acidimicrobiales bacterium]